MPLETLYDLWELGAEHRPGVALPIAVTRAVGSPPHPDPFTFAVQTSATLGEAIAAAIVHLPLRATSFQLELLEQGDEAHLVQLRPPSSRLGRRLALETTLAEMLHLLRRFHPTFVPVRVELEYGPAAYAEAYREHCRCPITHRASRSAIVLERAQLALPMPGGDPAMAAYFEARCREALATLSGRDDLVEAVRGQVVRALPARPSIAAVAQRLGVSERTLRRRLTEHETSFEAIVTAIRVALADQHLLRSDLNLSEIAYLVGFSEVSAFHRFYKRETGSPPRRGPR